MLKTKRAFTLIELLVVISIIILALAMAVPAVSKFSRGQALKNAGRLIQSAFNEARRAAITTRKPHYLIVFREQRQNPVREIYGLRAFQQGKIEGDGYTDGKFFLPNSIALHTRRVAGVQGLYGVVQEPLAADLPPGVTPGSDQSGCKLAVFDQCPYPGPSVLDKLDPKPASTAGDDWLGVAGAYETFFQFPSMRPRVSGTGGVFSYLRFNRDGTAEFVGLAADPDVRPQIVAGDNLYDRNVNFSEGLLIEDQILADFTLRQNGEPKKRCYVDVEPNTGRVRFRVVALNGYSGDAGGVATTTTGN